MSQSEPGLTPPRGTSKGFAKRCQQESLSMLTQPLLRSPTIMPSSDSPVAKSCLPAAPTPQQKRALPTPGTLLPLATSSFCADPTAL